MRINPIRNYSNLNYRTNKMPVKYSQNTINPNFEGKHKYAMIGAGAFGSLGTLAAIGGALILTGAYVIPIVSSFALGTIIYGGVVGHQIDKYKN